VNTDCGKDKSTGEAEERSTEVAPLNSEMVCRKESRGMAF
jgi:hypothetical protein